MLSICIPVYNYDMRRLMYDLNDQAVKANIPFEILLIDDASLEEYRKINSTINLLNFRYIQLEDNIGRSKIRNKLAIEAKYTYLLYMDCDSGVPHENYIKNYINYCRPGIVCSGGRIYEEKKPDAKKYLRWKYGIEREAISVSQRQQASNFGFESNNFLIDRNIFYRVKFDESLEGYGHEDTFFGIQLLIENISIEHIDNPLIHLGLEDADVFLKKTENAVVNLDKMNEILKSHYPQYANHSRLIKTKNRLDKTKLTFFVKFFFQIMQPKLRKILLGKNPSLFLLDIYKIGFFCFIRK